MSNRYQVYLTASNQVSSWVTLQEGVSFVVHREGITSDSQLTWRFQVMVGDDVNDPLTLRDPNSLSTIKHITSNTTRMSDYLWVGSVPMAFQYQVRVEVVRRTAGQLYVGYGSR